MQSCPIFCFLFLFNSDRDREQKNVLQEAWKKLGLGKWNFTNGNSKVTENRQDGVYDKNGIFGTKLDLIWKEKNWLNILFILVETLLLKYIRKLNIDDVFDYILIFLI